MNEINKETMLEGLCISYSGLRDRVVNSATHWISSDGRFNWTILVGELSTLLTENISEGDYSGVDDLFLYIESLLEKGDEEVSILITTTFLEGMLNSRDVDESLWRPLIGNKSEEYCKKLDEFYG
jgi:hypothetical protein